MAPISDRSVHVTGSSTSRRLRGIGCIPLAVAQGQTAEGRRRAGKQGKRLQLMGMSYMVLGVVITVGILILNTFHPFDPNRRAGLLGGSEGFILVGAALFLVGWDLRRKTRGILRP